MLGAQVSRRGEIGTGSGMGARSAAAAAGGRHRAWPGGRG